MRKITYTLAAIAFGLFLASTVQANGGRNSHNPGHPGVRPTFSGPRTSSFTIRSSNIGGIRTVNFGNFKSTPNAGRNYSYTHRHGHWGPRVWCAGCGCWCYWVPDADCYYYWYEPDQCYYPLNYCPSGVYNYVEP
jgi:hypothetical protein